MPTPLIECIPNFSEARRPEIVAQIVNAITAVKGITLLNHSSDEDHNRSVVTFAGPPDAVEEAAFRGIKKAAELINMDEHSGSHPRLGATDVVPFVPLAGVEMAECVSLAQRLGERVGNELKIPVYFYEEAAIRPDRKNLEDVRRGQYEGLKNEIANNPDRAPDRGPSALGTAGATIIGARNPLIAFNVYLTTDDVSIAKSIAKAIRHSSGGYRYIKGLGMLVDGRAQVSMNLTNFRQTPVFRVVETIRKEAERYGVGIHHSELIGLIPQEALIDSAAWYLQLDDFNNDQILEKRLYEPGTQIGSGNGDDFLDSLAAGTATPGGGSAAAYAGAMGAALAAMVARLTIGKKKYSDVEPQMNEILDQAELLRGRLTKAVEEDAEAFAAIMSAFKLPKNTSDEIETRRNVIEAATLHAAEVPLATAEMAVKTMELAERCVAIGNINAISDAGSAFHMCRAALLSAGHNVRINIDSISDKHVGDMLLNKLEALEKKAELLEKALAKTFQTRVGSIKG